MTRASKLGFVIVGVIPDANGPARPPAPSAVPIESRGDGSVTRLRLLSSRVTIIGADAPSRRIGRRSLQHPAVHPESNRESDLPAEIRGLYSVIPVKNKRASHFWPALGWAILDSNQ